uniref:Uncharacterized protein n=1 Tax=Physcomitrium patens TaxID=3218 RepID=A0A2K1IMW5_PHYPA|nr:hypothetical protein PHYPA_026930 [Physcomitrium patens]
MQCKQVSRRAGAAVLADRSMDHSCAGTTTKMVLIIPLHVDLDCQRMWGIGSPPPGLPAACLPAPAPASLYLDKLKRRGCRDAWKERTILALLHPLTVRYSSDLGILNPLPAPFQLGGRENGIQFLELGLAGQLDALDSMQSIVLLHLSSSSAAAAAASSSSTTAACTTTVMEVWVKTGCG